MHESLCVHVSVYEHVCTCVHVQGCEGVCTYVLLLFSLYIMSLMRRDKCEYACTEMCVCVGRCESACGILCHLSKVTC
jgi:hypothetical protein